MWRSTIQINKPSERSPYKEVVMPISFETLPKKGTVAEALVSSQLGLTQLSDGLAEFISLGQEEVDRFKHNGGETMRKQLKESESRIAHRENREPDFEFIEKEWSERLTVEVETLKRNKERHHDIQTLLSRVQEIVKQDTVSVLKISQGTTVQELNFINEHLKTTYPRNSTIKVCLDVIRQKIDHCLTKVEEKKAATSQEALLDQDHIIPLLPYEHAYLSSLIQKEDNASVKECRDLYANFNNKDKYQAFIQSLQGEATPLREQFIKEMIEDRRFFNDPKFLQIVADVHATLGTHPSQGEIAQVSKRYLETMQGVLFNFREKLPPQGVLKSDDMLFTFQGYMSKAINQAIKDTKTVVSEGLKGCINQLLAVLNLPPLFKQKTNLTEKFCEIKKQFKTVLEEKNPPSSNCHINYRP